MNNNKNNVTLFAKIAVKSASGELWCENRQ